MFEYLFKSRPRMSSKSSDGDTAAMALVSSFRETVPGSLCGSTMALNKLWCSSSSRMPALDNAAPNSCRPKRRVPVLPTSICCSACRMEPQPSATSFLRRSSMVRTGAAASTAMWNSCREMVPLLSESRNSKIFKCCSRDKPPRCLLRKRLNSHRVNSRWPQVESVMKESKAFVIVGNLSRIIFLKETSSESTSIRDCRVFLSPVLGRLLLALLLAFLLTGDDSRWV
mmetsp:Transcript_122584/g.357989  ORF Transcript_122584/g.357989 Transcript_122584/m.357989 type:complete len:227 (+) Transcript_122584:1476-2156(+)